MSRLVEKEVGNIGLVFDEAEQQTADIVIDACSKAVRLAQKKWNLRVPEHCSIFVMTSALGFIFRSAPFGWRILLALSIPLWLQRVRKTWPLSAAWTQRYGNRIAIGIKPWRIRGRQGVESRYYVADTDPNSLIGNATCHELIHACSSNLNLPMWLNEGLAMVTVDAFAGKPTIKQDTIWFIESAGKVAPPDYRRLTRMPQEMIENHAVRAYWIVRYLEEVRPGFLKRTLGDPDRRSVDERIAAALGIPYPGLWEAIDGLLLSRFSRT